MAESKQSLDVLLRRIEDGSQSGSSSLFSLVLCLTSRCSWLLKPTDREGRLRFVFSRKVHLERRSAVVSVGSSLLLKVMW
jgi:hypothetical protein